MPYLAKIAGDQEPNRLRSLWNRFELRRTTAKGEPKLRRAVIWFQCELLRTCYFYESFVLRVVIVEEEACVLREHVPVALGFEFDASIC